jgi:hypothetical protein
MPFGTIRPYNQYDEMWAILGLVLVVLLPCLIYGVWAQVFSSQETRAEWKKRRWLCVFVFVEVMLITWYSRKNIRLEVAVIHPLLALWYATGVHLLRHAKRADRIFGAVCASIAFAIIMWLGERLIGFIPFWEQAFWQTTFRSFMCVLAVVTLCYAWKTRQQTTRQ